MSRGCIPGGYAGGGGLDHDCRDRFSTSAGLGFDFGVLGCAVRNSMTRDKARRRRLGTTCVWCMMFTNFGLEAGFVLTAFEWFRKGPSPSRVPSFGPRIYWAVSSQHARPFHKRAAPGLSSSCCWYQPDAFFCPLALSAAASSL